MSTKFLKSSRSAGSARSAALRFAPSLAVLAALALSSGCMNRDSVTVGAVPDDYRTNHPIIISEKEEFIDIPVGVDDLGASRAQKSSVGGFLDAYDVSAAPVVRIMVPAGSANEAAANRVAADLVYVLRQNGVRPGRIATLSYSAGSAEAAAPIRISYVGIKASTDKCGRWPDDLADTTENRHYANFGCSYQNNLAAQVANPADLLGPRKTTEIDAANRGVAIDDYQNRVRDFPSEVDY
jgi:pilus assembly protein CpaD